MIIKNRKHIYDYIEAHLAKEEGFTSGPHKYVHAIDGMLLFILIDRIKGEHSSYNIGLRTHHPKTRETMQSSKVFTDDEFLGAFVDEFIVMMADLVALDTQKAREKSLECLRELEYFRGLEEIGALDLKVTCIPVEAGVHRLIIELQHVPSKTTIKNAERVRGVEGLLSSLEEMKKLYTVFLEMKARPHKPPSV